MTGSVRTPSRSLRNFRDVAALEGLRTVLRPGVLLRSDSPHVLEMADVGVLVDDWGIGTCIDLRSVREADAEPYPDHLVRAVTRHHFPMAGGAGTAIEAASSGQRLAARYLEYLQDHADSVVAAVRAVADQHGRPVLLHCRAGKDRTGVVVALLLSACGVSDDLVVRDYELTTAAMAEVLAELRASPTYAANVTRLPEEMYRSDAPTMTAFLRSLREQHGGASTWLVDHGLPERTLADLARHLLRDDRTDPEDAR